MRRLESQWHCIVGTEFISVGGDGEPTAMLHHDGHKVTFSKGGIKTRMNDGSPEIQLAQDGDSANATDGKCLLYR